MVKGARSAGSFLGGIFNNPGVVILGGLAIALLFFSGDIRKAFGSLGQSFGKIELPDITLPSITLPEITFPEFPTFETPDVSGFFEDLQSQFNEFIANLPGLPGGETPPLQETDAADFPTEDPLPPVCECGSTIVQDASGQVTQTCLACNGGDTFETPGGLDIDLDPDLGIPVEGDPGFIGPIQPPSSEPLPPGVIDVPIEDPFGLGGGPGFEGGMTIFGGGIVDTLSEVLALFPSLTASQAADALAEFPGLTQAEFAQIDADIINISSGETPPGGTMATLESEAQRAACTSCQLFGLNCPLCQGTL